MWRFWLGTGTGNVRLPTRTAAPWLDGHQAAVWEISAHAPVFGWCRELPHEIRIDPVAAVPLLAGPTQVRDSVMPTPRRNIVDDDVVGDYHLISRCVRQCRLCGDELEHRRDWIERRIAQLQRSMAIDLTAWNILSNHLHILATNRPDVAKTWSDREVALRWLRLFPAAWLRRKKGIPMAAPPTEEEIAAITRSRIRVKVLRKRLSSVSWFMKALKEHISRRANAEDGCTGTFWERRFRSIRILDEPAKLITATYIDLNGVRAGMVTRPELTSHGSISERAAMVAGLPRRTRIRMADPPSGSNEAYLEHVDTCGRWQQRSGTGVIPASLLPILERLELTKRRWLQLAREGWEQLRGTAIGSAESRQREAERRRCRWVIDVLAS